jgi:hypothetical protein
MKLLTVGDSFTYGEELADRMVAWPYLLGKILGVEVTNLGRPSKSNTYITRQTVEHAQDYDLIVIAWSHFARMEFADDYGTYELWPGCAGNLFKNEVEYRKNLLDYTNRYHSDQYLYTQQLLNIILLQNYLKQNNKKYLMLTSFNQNYGALNTSSLRLSCRDLLKQIDSTYYVGWPNESMMEWTYNTPQGPGGHFLEQGHEKVADKIYEYIRNLSWVS